VCNAGFSGVISVGEDLRFPKSQKRDLGHPIICGKVAETWATLPMALVCIVSAWDVMPSDFAIQVPVNVLAE
jgi:hypothetical protein